MLLEMSYVQFLVKINREEWVITYVSRTLSKALKSYSVYKNEGLAIIFAVKHLCPYIHILHFIIENDIAPLK